MADFVAVIRRAVDGLSDNTPEMRVKVYEKARGAVRRQLESMKPVPSEAMIGRQIDKLESAINAVESEHAEALPPVDDAPEDLAAAGRAPDFGQQDATTEQGPPAEEIAPAGQESYQSAEYHEEAHHEEAQAEAGEVPAERHDDASQPVIARADEIAPEQIGEEMAGKEPVEDEPVGEEPADVDAVQPTPLGLQPVEAFDAPVDAEVDAQIDAGRDDVLDAADLPETAASRSDAADAPEDAPDPVTDVPGQAPPADGIEPPAQEDRPFASYPGNDGMETDPGAHEPPPEQKAAPAVWDLSDWKEQGGSAPEAGTQAAPSSGEASFDEPLAGRDRLAGVDADYDEGIRAERPEEWSWGDKNPFEASQNPAGKVSAELPPLSDPWSWPVEKQAEPAGEPETEKKPGAWDDLDDLIGIDRSAPAADNAASPAGSDAVTAAQSHGEKSRSRSRLLPIALSLCLVALLGGGAYAYWQERETVNSWISDLVTAVMPADTGPSGAGTGNTTGSGTPGSTGIATDDGGETDVAALDAGSSKFTQRLQLDGTEVDPGPAALPDGDGTVEGTTITAQTDTGASISEGGAAAATIEGGDATVATGQADEAPQVAGAEQIPAGVGERMFLYEERLGQTSPTAIEGTVAWSVKEESGADARPEQVIEGRITVPGRGLTALMTIKRNADPSLPASHLIEFVFSMPATFEGGAIETVQRVAMKRNEQDRGDPLIGVPAKITDDFHMIALNDFPEAIAANLELLRSRAWIDIPIIYRNGRRALITIQKGATGIEVFNTVMQGWANATNAAATGQ